MEFLYLLLIVAGLILVIRPITVFIHELGHAIPAILLTGKKATIYIGSYGNPEKSLKINLGILVIFFQYNPFAWRQGLCVPSSQTISINKQIIYTLTGPLASLLAGSIACYFAFAFDLHGFLKLFLIVFLPSAILDLVANLIPDPVPVKLYDGTIVYNDGYSLKRLLYHKWFPDDYAKARELYNNQQYSGAAILLEKMLSKGITDEDIYRTAIHCHFLNKNYNKAKELADKFMQTGKMNADDLPGIALICCRSGFYNEGIEFYDKILQQNSGNKDALNNKGYTLNLLNRFEEAIAVFNKAIELDANCGYSYSNRGLAKIKLGLREEGLQDIHHSFELDMNNSYCYMNLGIYHFDKGKFDEALQQFLKAKELDDTTHKIDELLNQTRQKLTEMQPQAP